MKNKKYWIIDLLKLCRFHTDFNKDILIEAWDISEETAVQVLTEMIMNASNRKIKPFKFIGEKKGKINEHT